MQKKLQHQKSNIVCVIGAQKQERWHGQKRLLECECTLRERGCVPFLGRGLDLPSQHKQFMDQSVKLVDGSCKHSDLVNTTLSDEVFIIY